MGIMSRATLPTSLADLTLPDSDEREHRLSEFWEDNPVVFVWLRHYG